MEKNAKFMITDVNNPDDTSVVMYNFVNDSGDDVVATIVGMCNSGSTKYESMCDLIKSSNNGIDFNFITVKLEDASFKLAVGYVSDYATYVIMDPTFYLSKTFIKFILDYSKTDHYNKAKIVNFVY